MALFSLLEQHKNGAWWYHPGDTFNTPEEVEERFIEEFFIMSPDRPYKVFEHSEHLPQEFATCTYDFNTFEFLGVIHWPKGKKGQLIRDKRLTAEQYTILCETIRNFINGIIDGYDWEIDEYNFTDILQEELIEPFIEPLINGRL